MQLVHSPLPHFGAVVPHESAKYPLFSRLFARSPTRTPIFPPHARILSRVEISSQMRNHAGRELTRRPPTMAQVKFYALADFSCTLWVGLFSASLAAVLRTLWWLRAFLGTRNSGLHLPPVSSARRLFLVKPPNRAFPRNSLTQREIYFRRSCLNHPSEIAILKLGARDGNDSA